MNFKIGDVVSLKSGGPRMTITGIIGEDEELSMLKISGFEDGDMTVEYFDKSTLVKNTFRKTSVELIDDSLPDSVSI